MKSKTATSRIIHRLDPETYVLCEKAASAAKKSVAEWVSEIVSARVGHTPFAKTGRAFPVCRNG